MTEARTADREWYLEARVQIIKACGASNVYGASKDFAVGQRLNMVRWGRAGRTVDTAWWTSYDIDGAFIITDDHVRIINVTREVSPFETAPGAHTPDAAPDVP